MAKIDFKGLEEYTKMLESLGKDLVTVEKITVYEGADLVADGIRETIESWPTHKNAKDGMTKIEQQALLTGLGTSGMKNDDGTLNVKIGFAGYNERVKTKAHPNGVPIPLTARSLRKGTSWRRKDDFMGKAVSKYRKKAESAMEKKLEDEIMKRTK